jgi:hypothetical protein
MTQHDYTRVIIDQINSLLIDEIGPAALILTEDAEEEWSAKLIELKLRKNLRSILIYVDIVSLYIEDIPNRENFLKIVYEINGLKGYKL